MLPAANGVVHHAIDPAVRSQDFRHHRLYRRGLADVRLEGASLPALASDLRAQTLGLLRAHAVHGRDFGAVCGQNPADVGSDPTSAACDHRDLALEQHAKRPSPECESNDSQWSSVSAHRTPVHTAHAGTWRLRRLCIGELSDATRPSPAGRTVAPREAREGQRSCS